MKLTDKLAHAALAAIVTTGMSLAVSSQAIAAKPKMIKCYGVAKAKKNDCGTAKHACAGQATTNYDPSEWVFATPEQCKALQAKVKAAKDKTK